MSGSLPVFHGRRQRRPHLRFHHGGESAGFLLPHVLVRAQRRQPERGGAGGLHGESNRKPARQFILTVEPQSQAVVTSLPLSFSSATRNVWTRARPAWPPACRLRRPTRWLAGSRRACRACWAALRATGRAPSRRESQVEMLHRPSNTSSVTTDARSSHFPSGHSPRLNHLPLVCSPLHSVG